MKEIKEYAILSRHISDFYTCSKDDSDQNHVVYMNVPKEKCVCFDDVTKELTSIYDGDIESAASTDSLTRGRYDEPILIEFKNGKIHGKNKSTKLNIREKMCNTILSLEAILDEQWTDLRLSMQYILVYNVEKNPREDRIDIHEHMNNKAQGTTNIRFGLERYVNMYYKTVRTLSEEEFTQAVIAGEFKL